MGLRRPLIAVCVLCLWLLHQCSAYKPDVFFRVKRQEPDPEPEADSAPEDFVADYAGNNEDDTPKEEVRRDTIDETFTNTQNNDINEDRFGEDTFDESPRIKKEKSKSVESEESKPKKKVKKYRYLKKTFDFLKRVLDPEKLMQNAFITEALRRFSHHEDPESVEHESESKEEEHTPPPVKKRGRPRKKDKIPLGITGMIKKGVMSLTQMELDRKKLRRRVRMIKRIARKAKRPLKTAVKIFLSSRNQAGYGGGGYGNTNY